MSGRSCRLFPVSVSGWVLKKPQSVLCDFLSENAKRSRASLKADDLPVALTRAMREGRERLLPPPAPGGHETRAPARGFGSVALRSCSELARARRRPLRSPAIGAGNHPWGGPGGQEPLSRREIPSRAATPPPRAAKEWRSAVKPRPPPRGSVSRAGHPARHPGAHRSGAAFRSR